MATGYEGIAARLNFTQPGRAARKAWPKSKLEAGQPVAEVLEALKERPGFAVDDTGDWLVELRGVVAGDVDAVAAQVASLAQAAAAKGAHAEWARFPLEGAALACQVWDGKRKKFVEAAPEARQVQADYRFIQKELREEAKKLGAAPRKPTAEPGLVCGCGAAVARTAPRCKACGRDFRAPLRTDAPPSNWSEAVSAARKQLHALGLYPDPDAPFEGFAELHPETAKQALGAADVLRDVGFTLLAPEELARREALYADASGWPRKFPLGRAKDLRAWVEEAMERAGEAERATVERLVAEKGDTLKALRDVGSHRIGWATAAAEAGVEGVDVVRLGEQFNVLLAVAGEAPVGSAEWAQRAVLRMAPERVPASGKRAQAKKAAAPAKRVSEEQVAAPPGIEGREAWALEVHRVKTPKVRCPECGASNAPKAELRIPALGKAVGARTVRVYECEACAREEPLDERVQVRVEAGAPKGTKAPASFVDYPEADEARRLVKKGFDAKRYRTFLEQRGLLEPRAAKLAGCASGYEDPEQLKLGVSCNHPTELLHLSPHALGLQLPKSRVAVELCVKPGCEKPGVAEEVSTG